MHLGSGRRPYFVGLIKFDADGFIGHCGNSTGGSLALLIAIIISYFFWLVYLIIFIFSIYVTEIFKASDLLLGRVTGRCHHHPDP